MHRFIAMLWDEQAQDRTLLVQRWCETLARSSTQWTTVLEGPGILVLAMRSSTGVLRASKFAAASGAAIGVVYVRGREEAGPMTSISPTLTQQIAATSGGALLKEAWGQYIAIWRDEVSGQITVMRDPSGAVSCLMTEARGVTLLFSFVEDIAGLEGLTFSIDWKHVRAFLYHNYFATKHTGLSEISELMPGERLCWTRCAPPTFSWAWDPVTIAADADERNIVELRQDIRETLETCVAASARSYRSVVLQLSGGLDSSILLALLKRAAGATITPLHTVNSGYEGYELDLARLASEHVGARLIERPLDPRHSDLNTILEAPRLPRPARQVLGIQANRMISSVCEDVGADAVMAGHGGDTLFLQRVLAEHLVSDLIQTRGLGSGVFRTAYDQATLEQRSIWSVLRQTANNLISKNSWAPYAFVDASRGDTSPVFAPFRSSNVPVSYWEHPWLERAAALPPGKREQVAGFIGLYNYFVQYGYGVTLDAINPYQSQPIVELSLHIPTYQLVRGGRDRSLQRSAFADLLPNRIVRRTSKGLINHQLLVAFGRNLPFLRELVLDGAIVQKDWVDRPKAEALFSQEQLVHGKGLMVALGLVAAEAWLHGWRHQAR